MKTDNMIEALNSHFPSLTEENKNKIIDMTKFLVLTQNTIVPEMIKIEKNETWCKGTNHGKNHQQY